MKKTFILFYLGVLITLAHNSVLAQIPYQINGKWENGTGKKLSLKLLSAGNMTGISVDSATVAPDGTFSLEGTVKEMGYGTLSDANGKYHGYRVIFFDGNPIELQLADTIIQMGKQKKNGIVFHLTKGNKEQKASQEILRFFSDHFIRSFNNAFASVALERKNNTQHTTDSLNAVITQIEKADKEEIANFFQTYSDCLAAPFFMEMNMLKELPGSELQSWFNSLSDKAKASPKGKEIEDIIRKINLLSPGATAPNFELTTPDGKQLSLKDFRGHIVLIDFWASWCAPCLGEMPNLKAIYDKYHTKGLEVIGVSMDNSKTAWTKAIEREALPWHHASSLKGMQHCPVAESYQVLAIPKLYIIGKDGKIIEKDLRGKALADKIEEIIIKNTSNQ